MWPKKTSNFINEDKNLNLKTQVVLVQYLEAQIIGQPSSKAQSTWGRTENGQVVKPTIPIATERARSTTSTYPTE